MSPDPAERSMKSEEGELSGTRRIWGQVLCVSRIVWSITPNGRKLRSSLGKRGNDTADMLLARITLDH